MSSLHLIRLHGVVATVVFRIPTTLTAADGYTTPPTGGNTVSDTTTHTGEAHQTFPTAT